MWRYLIPVGLFAALIAFFFFGLGRDKETLPSPLIGKPAPITTYSDVVASLNQRKYRWGYDFLPHDGKHKNPQTGESAEILLKGKTTVWLTKAEGLPIKIEITTGEGKVAIYWCFTELRINQGLHPGELVLGAPAGTRLIAASADLKDKNWEEKMDRSITLQLEAIEKERQASNSPTRPRKRK